jgi:predicted nuclease of predicted toxin-antitoxin system
MLRLLSDENLNGDIVRGLLLRRPDLDLSRVQDVGLEEADDPTILEWAAVNNRIVLTHD